MSTPPPNPYAQPQFPQQQYPQYPQQGYGGQPPYPQPGYGQQPYPGPGGWGGPPMHHPPTPPPKKNQGPMIALITVAAIVVLVAISWFGNNVNLRSGGGGGSFPKAEYQLTVPATLLDGKYKLSEDQSDKHQDMLAGTSEANIRDTKATVAQYLSASESDVLIVSGMYGRIKDPDEARSRILKGATESDGSTIAVPAMDVTPTGSEVTITCQVLTTEQADGGTSTLPMCAWADDNTNAAVALVTPDVAAQAPEEVDLTAAAEATAKIREEMRKPIG